MHKKVCTEKCAQKCVHRKVCTKMCAQKSVHKILLKVQIDMWILRRDYAISIIIYRIRGGTKSSMFPNYLDFGNVPEVRSSVFGQNHMFRHV